MGLIDQMLSDPRITFNNWRPNRKMNRAFPGDAGYAHGQCRWNYHEPENTDLHISCEIPTNIEIVAAIIPLKNNNFPRIYNIAAEFLKAGPPVTGELLLPIIKKVWVYYPLPSDWTQGNTVILSKKGDLTICRNWRGITLLLVINKIFTTNILKRFTKCWTSTQSGSL